MHYQQPDSALPQVVSDSQKEISYQSQAPLEPTPQQPDFYDQPFPDRAVPTPQYHQEQPFQQQPFDKHYNSYNTSPPVPPEIAHSKEDKQNKLLGLRKPTFFLSLALVCMVIVAAIAGGVGGSIAVENARKEAAEAAKNTQGTPTTGSGGSSASQSPLPNESGTASLSVLFATPSPSPTSSGEITTTRTVLARPTEGMLDFDCPSYTGGDGETANGSKKFVTVNGSRKEFTVFCHKGMYGSNIDIMTTMAFTMEDCMGDCANMNRVQRNNTCVGVHFTANLDFAKAYANKNCFMKGYLNGGKLQNDGSGDHVAAGVLVV